MLLEENSAPFYMLGWMLDLSRMFRIAGDNWVTLQAKLQDQQPKANPASAWAQLRGSRTAAETLLCFTPKSQRYSKQEGVRISPPSWIPKTVVHVAWLLPLFLLAIFVRHAFPSSLLIKQTKKKQTKNKSGKLFLADICSCSQEEAIASGVLPSNPGASWNVPVKFSPEFCFPLL